ncbi:hypothetical protein D3C76_1488900 [compost metagenome]
MLGFTRRIDIHLSAGADDDRFVGFVQGQYVKDVAERIQLRPHRPGQIQLPAQHMLAFAVVGRQAQVLDAGAHLIFIVVGRFVADRESHMTSR